MSPSKPTKVCRVCQRKNCTDPAHKPVPFGGVNKRSPTPAYRADAGRRKAARDAWCAVNCERQYVAEGWRWVGVCPDCGQTRKDWVADHVTPVALGGGEDGELRVHCRTCSTRQGGVVANASIKLKRQRRAQGDDAKNDVQE
jgi:hypothetical protein